MNAQSTKSLFSQSVDLLDVSDMNERDIAAVLAQHPEQAETLRPLIEMAAMTSRFYTDVPEPPGGLMEGRARVLAEAAAQRERFVCKPGKAKRRLSLFWRFAGAVLAMLLTLLPLRSTLVAAAGDSLPGHPFYMLKLSAEDQLFKSVDEAEVKVVLAISLAEERVSEVRALVARQQAIPVDVLYRMDYMLRTALTAAAFAPERVMPNMLDYITHHMRVQVQELEAVKANATSDNLPMVNTIQMLCLKTQVIAMVAWENPRVFRNAYQAGTPEKMPLPSGNPLSGVVITEELWDMATSTPDSFGATPSPEIPTATSTPTPTSTATPTSTPTPTPTATATPTSTLTPTATATPVPAPVVMPTSTTDNTIDDGENGGGNPDSSSGQEGHAEPGSGEGKPDPKGP